MVVQIIYVIISGISNAQFAVCIVVYGVVIRCSILIHACDDEIVTISTRINCTWSCLWNA